MAGACGAVLGGAIGTVVRNPGGAVTAAVVVLVITPPLIIQLAPDSAPWVPSALSNVVSGVSDDTSVAAAVGALVLWAVAPALAALQSVRKRDVV